MTEEAHYKFGIQMSCGGCSGAVERVLKRMEGDGGVKSYAVSLDTQTADVTADASLLSYDTLLEKLKKTGKTVKSAERDGETLEV